MPPMTNRDTLNDIGNISFSATSASMKLAPQKMVKSRSKL